MLHASALAIGWRSALQALVQAHRDSPVAVSAEYDRGPVGDDRDDEREPFHLDDPELAPRLVPDRGLVNYRTPPHACLVFPFLPEQ